MGVTDGGAAVTARAARPIGDGARGATVEALAARVLAAPPRGACRVVAVDGFAGAGKTTFAGRLAAALGHRLGCDEGSPGVPVIHTDEFASHDDFFGWDARLVAQVLAPLAAGRAAAYAPYDWVARRPVGHRLVPAASVVVVEGVGCARRSLLPHLSVALWLDVPVEVATARGTRRDGPELADFWRAWTAAQRAFFADERPWRHAETVRPDAW